MNLHVFAAGSLREAMTEIASAFGAAHGGVSIQLTFAAAGLLKDRITNGERADVFASANMEHPQALADAGLASPARCFARNALCALALQSTDVTSANLVQRMLDARVKLGTSTPVTDPSGDYAWEMFQRIEQCGNASAFAALAAKALQLTGSAHSPKPPPGKNVYGVLVAQGQADIFITYRTNALLAVREQPALLKMVEVPVDINVGARYGVATLAAAHAAACAFMDFLLSGRSQDILARLGFLPGDGLISRPAGR